MFMRSASIATKTMKQITNATMNCTREFFIAYPPAIPAAPVYTNHQNKTPKTSATAVKRAGPAQGYFS